MSQRLRRRYRRLLLAYPPAYRASRGEEILTTLVEAARPGQRFPTVREAAGLLLGGLRARARQAAADPPERPLTDGLHLGVVLVVLVNLGTAAGVAALPLWTVLVGVGALATLRGLTRTALAITAATAVVVARPLLPSVELPWWLPGYADWSALAGFTVALTATAWRTSRPRPPAP